MVRTTGEVLGAVRRAATGDDANLFRYGALAVASLSGLGGWAIGRHGRKKKEEDEKKNKKKRKDKK